MAFFCVYFDINSKLLSGKNTQKIDKQKNSGFIKLGVRWAEWNKRQLAVTPIIKMWLKLIFSQKPF